MSLHIIQNFFKTTVSQIWETGTGIRYVAVKPTPSSGWLVLSPSNESLREIIFYTSTGSDSTGDYIVVSQRGIGGTTEQAHEIGEPVRMNITAEHIDEISDALDQIVAGGAQDASTATKGIVKLNVAPTDPAEPIALGANTVILPTGGVIPYAGSTAPTGFLLCDGAAVSRSTYATLFGIISTNYGVGNGTTTFNLPDLRSRIAVGVGTGTKVATFASRASNVITVTGLSNKANNEFQTGQAVLYSAPSGAMTGLTHNTTYYIVKTGNLTFSLASSLANAQNGTVISLSSDGTGVQTFTLTLTARAIGESGGEENHAMSVTELLSHTHGQSNWAMDVPHQNGGGASAHGTSNNLNQGPMSTIDNTGGNVAMNAMNPFVALNYIIKI